MAARKVLGVFAVTSLLMWALPLGVLQLFNQNLIPGLGNMSSRSKTLWSGGLAVLSVNFMIVVYIFLALREPAVAVSPQPDPSFARRAKASQAAFGGNQAALSKPTDTVSIPEVVDKSSKSD